MISVRLAAVRSATARGRDGRDALALLLLGDRRDVHAEFLDTVREVAPEPFGDAAGQRGDDDLVEAGVSERRPDRLRR